MKVRRLTAVLVSLGFILVPLSAHSNQSQESLDISNPIEVMQRMVPELIKETSKEDHVTVQEGSDGIIVKASEFWNGDELLNHGIDFTLLESEKIVGVSSDIYILSHEMDDIFTFVQPVPNGVRTLTVIDNEKFDGNIRHIIDVPEGSELVESMSGFHVTYEDEIFFSVGNPWAIDSSGKNLETHYILENSVLTQVVDLKAPGTQFPVLVDPYWGYTMTFALAKTPLDAWNGLNLCFKCKFPLAGAPHIFPGPNQLMPLKMTVAGIPLFNAEVRRGPVSIGTGLTYFAFQLNATANHFDGYGSSIIFEIKKIGTNNRLVVDAYIVNDFLFGGNFVYRQAAQQYWQDFAIKLGQ